MSTRVVELVCHRVGIPTVTAKAEKRNARLVARLKARKARGPKAAGERR